MDLLWYGRCEMAGPTAVGFVSPGAAFFVCRDCKAQHCALLRWSTDGIDTIQFVDGVSIATAHTPASVEHYLKQSALARAAGAHSAAVAMARVALEHLLFDQGFTEGMLGKQIADLGGKIADGSAPKWARELDIDLLKMLKDVGNGALHKNDGDITLQDHFDQSGLDDVEFILESLLDVVYERPAADAARRDRMAKRAEAFNAKKG